MCVHAIRMEIIKRHFFPFVYNYRVCHYTDVLAPDTKMHKLTVQKDFLLYTVV